MSEDAGSRDRNLLFGVMAVQLHLIKPADLARAAAVWAAEADHDLGEVLVELGSLSDKDREMISGLLDRQLDHHGGDASRTLASFGGAKAVKESFAASLLVRVDDGGIESFGGDFCSTGKASPAPGGALEGSERVTAEDPGRYTIKGEHGRGGIGRVLLAFDEHVGREVALKELLPDSCVSQSSGPTPVTGQAAVRFLREARITAQLEHPGIVPVYELGRRPDGSLYYTMKLVRGATLSKRLSECKDLSDRLRLLPHFYDLCQAMAYAHVKGVVHRDLKPQNLMVGEFGETVLLDWGLAKIKGIADDQARKLEREVRLIKDAGADQTVSGSPIGTPSYMSPEQAEGNIAEIDEKSDVWSLGAILYEILAGEPPYTGGSAYEVLGRVLMEEVKPVRQVEPQAPVELAAICMKCLCKNRDGRYADAAEVARDVSAFEAGGLVSAYDYSIASLVGRFIKRHWAILSVVSAALVLALVMAVVFVARLRAERDQTVNNLAEAYYQYGLRQAEAGYAGSARVYFAKALALTGRPDARMELYKQELTPVRVSLAHSLAAPDWTQAAAFSDSGGLAAIGGRSKNIEVVSSKDGKQLFSLLGHKNTVLDLAFSPDGKTIVSGGADKLIILWSAKTGELSHTLAGHADAVSSVAFSKTGDRILSGGWDGRVIAWSATTLEILKTYSHHRGYVSAVAWLSPRTAVSASGDATVKTWNLDGDDPALTLAEFKDAVWALAVSPSRQLAAAGDLSGNLKICQIEKRVCPVSIQAHEGAVYDLAFLNDAFLVSAGADGSLKVWNAATGEPVDKMAAHPGEIFALAASGPGGMLATGSSDEARFFRVLERGIGRGGKVADSPVADFSRDGSFLATAEDESVTVWSVETAGRIGRIDLDSRVAALAFLPEGSMVAVGTESGNVAICSYLSGACSRSFRAHENGVESLAVTGNLVVTADGSGRVRGWTAEGGQVFSFENPEWWGDLSITLSDANVALAVIGSGSDRVDVCDLAEKECSKNITAGFNVTGFAFNPDGLTAALGGCGRYETPLCLEGAIEIRSLADGRLIKGLSGHGADVVALAFSEDGSYLASGSANNEVILWDSRAGVMLMKFPPMAGPVRRLSFDRSGKRLLCYGEGGTVTSWPIMPEVFETDGPELLKTALDESGFDLSGFELIHREPSGPLVQ